MNAVRSFPQYRQHPSCLMDPCLQSKDRTTFLGDKLKKFNQLNMGPTLDKKVSHELGAMLQCYSDIFAFMLAEFLNG